MATSSLASYPDSWSCAYNICTGTWSTSGGPQYSAVAIPIWNPAPSTEFEPANEEFVEFEPNAVNCDVDNAAVDAALAIKRRIDTDGIPNNTQDQTEYSAIIGQVGPDVKVGTVVQGTSYNQSPPATTDYSASWSSLRITYADTVGIIHYHPWNDRSDVRDRNKRPSPVDWQQADGLVAAGADPSRLTLYIIDNLGVLRAYPYAPPAQRTGTFPAPRVVSTACQ